VAETRNFTFTVRARTTSGKVVPILGLDYLEYAGGLLTDAEPGSTVQANLLAQIDSAHALLGLIDGFWLRKWLIEGDPNGRARLQQSLTAMISLMLLADCPVSFVITKWDLLHDLEVDENARLNQVRKRLMSNAGFRDLVTAHSSRRIIRLIPVSAVGLDFTGIDDQGAVTKRPDGQMDPLGVDVPLSAVVPDVFEQVEQAVDRARLEATLAGIRRSGPAGPAEALSELGSFVSKQATRALGMLAPHAAFIGDATLAFFSVDNENIDRSLSFDRKVDDATNELEEFRRARRRVLRDFQSRVDVLEGRLPASRISAES
jgi:hypothetical protein